VVLRGPRARAGGSARGAAPRPYGRDRTRRGSRRPGGGERTRASSAMSNDRTGGAGSPIIERGARRENLNGRNVWDTTVPFYPSFAGKQTARALANSFACRRSLHLPVAPTEGSLTSNLNGIRVRLWTDPIAATLTLSFTARWTSRAADIETLDQPLFEPKDVAD
jgi:hypothetical protein